MLIERTLTPEEKTEMTPLGTKTPFCRRCSKMNYEKAIERETPNKQHYEYLQKELTRQIQALPEQMKWLQHSKLPIS